jgi:hypothetical protein
MKFISILCFSVVLMIADLNAQCLSPVNFSLQKDIPASATPLFNHSMSAKRDSASSKPYLYVAGKALGLKVYDISNVSSPVLSTTIPTSSLNNLDVNSVTQAGNYLYLALGDHFNKNNQFSGMAIINITNPAAASVSAVYTYTAKSGAGHVAVEGNYAYVSAMQNGILVMDVTNKTNPILVSVFKPSIHFPKPNPNTSEQDKINARSIVAKNNVLYVCYDAGGVRIINATNKSNLLETGQYSNPLLLTRARAYNNLVLNDSLVYVAADYCGMEVLKIKDTSTITMVGWWNPWKCETSANTWFNSPGHTNEIEFDKNCKMLFMSAGKSDMIAVSVANPALPDSCSDFGTKLSGDTMGTWGLGHYQNQIYLCYISTWPFYVPFTGKWGGVKIINYNNSCTTGMNEISSLRGFEIYPNPSHDGTITFFNKSGMTGLSSVTVRDCKGAVCYQSRLDLSNQFQKLDPKLEDGFYFVTINSEYGMVTKKLVISRQ